MSLREPLARAKGHGSARKGTAHYIAYRVTSVAMVIFIPWFLISALMHLNTDYAGLVAWLKQPLTSVMSILFLMTLFYHFWLELKVVVEDYVSTPLRRHVTLIALKFAFIFSCVTGLFCLFKIVLGA